MQLASSKRMSASTILLRRTWSVERDEGHTISEWMIQPVTRKRARGCAREGGTPRKRHAGGCSGCDLKVKARELFTRDYRRVQLLQLQMKPMIDSAICIEQMLTFLYIPPYTMAPATNVFRTRKTSCPYLPAPMLSNFILLPHPIRARQRQDNLGRRRALNKRPHFVAFATQPGKQARDTKRVIWNHRSAVYPTCVLLQRSAACQSQKCPIRIAASQYWLTQRHSVTYRAAAQYHVHLSGLAHRPL